MNWEEACKYVWGTSGGDDFTLCIIDNHLMYKFEKEGAAWEFWCIPSEDNLYFLDSYEKVGRVPEFCGPIQPPPSAVILKIRQMEARRNHVQYR